MSETTGKTVTIAATNAEIGWPTRYSTIVVYNATTAAIYVTTDGSAASSAAGNSSSIAVPASTQAVFGNALPILDTAGGTTSLGGQTTANVLGASWQTFSGSTDSTNMTQVNLLGSGTGNVTVEVQ